MVKLIVFAVGSAIILFISRYALRHPKSHGFYRTFAWEAILALFLLNVGYWFVKPFAWYQIIAWILLILSLPLIIGGVIMLRRLGKPAETRQDAGLIGFEKTTSLVAEGLYKYIRHPLYSSLLFLAWGIFFKHLSWAGLVLATAATGFLVVTAKIDEKEDIAFFGEQYREYMKKTKMFVPLVY